MIVNHSLKVVHIALSLIQDNVIMHRASSTLDSGVGAEIEVVLERMSDITFDQSPRKRVVVSISRTSITFLGKETDTVSLCAHRNSPFDLQRLLANGSRIKNKYLH